MYIKAVSSYLLKCCPSTAKAAIVALFTSLSRHSHNHLVSRLFFSKAFKTKSCRYWTNICMIRLFPCRTRTSNPSVNGNSSQSVSLVVSYKPNCLHQRKLQSFFHKSPFDYQETSHEYLQSPFFSRKKCLHPYRLSNTFSSLHLS